MKILVVDDDQMMLESLIHFLRSEGYETVTANDGLKAPVLMLRSARFAFDDAARVTNTV